MNNEIKETLDEMINLNDYKDYKIYGKRANEIGKLLLDYITNLQQERDTYYSIVSQKLTKEIDYQRFNELQQENERLKETNVYCNRTDCVGRIKDSRKYDSVYQEKEDYKTRCEKAVEKINNFWKEKSYYESVENCLQFAIMNEFEKKDLLNILQNGSEK